ncbi:MAG: outer membrane protein transport protein [Pirellulaceae bacterium]|nr:outer membrane protein transport protein [Pirellulaceae bacterium]
MRYWHWCGLFLLLSVPATVCGQGIMLSTFGPVHAGMGGASTAAPIEALSALAWNPAAISGLPNSELSASIGLLLSDPVLDSSIPGLAAGSTGAEPGTVPVPNLGWVHRLNDVTTIGLGVMVVGGLKTNYPSSLTNPVLAPPSNTPGVPGGLGSLFAEAQFLQFAPTVSVAVTERLAIGFAPTITTGQIVADPLLVASPDDADGSGVPRYPAGRGTRYAWGGGAQLGMYYITDSCLHFGAAIKSPQWMEDFRMQTENELGLPYVSRFKFDLPMIVSLGAAYSGIEDLVLAVDFRYFDYRNTDGFGDQGYSPTGALNGLSWTNQFAVATGMQYRLADHLLVRAGYTYNTSPFPDEDTFYNVASLLNYQHQFGVGGSWELTECVALHLSYTHYFQWDSTGPIIPPTGPIPGSSVTNTASAHLAALGVTVKY